MENDLMEGKGIFVPPSGEIDIEKGKGSAEKDTLQIYKDVARLLEQSDRFIGLIGEEKRYAEFMKKISDSFVKHGVDTELGADAEEISKKIALLNQLIERASGDAMKILQSKGMSDLILEKGENFKNA